MFARQSLATSWSDPGPVTEPSRLLPNYTVSLSPTDLWPLQLKSLCIKTIFSTEFSLKLRDFRRL